MKPQVNLQTPHETVTRDLLEWYDRHRRDLPWRAKPGETAEPYRVWLSEIMLQQTTVATVRHRYAAFLERWPSVTALAEASLDDVLHEWQGLGYYARARNLHKCARVVAERPDAAFPTTEAELRELPGVGDYTAAAVAAIAFNEQAGPVDGNVIRVITRLHGIDDVMPAGKRAVSEAVEPLVPDDRPGDFAQAMMDLGATVCTPRNPACGICPWSRRCEARISGDPTAYPVKPAKKPRPTRYGRVFWMMDRDGRVAIRTRPEQGLLGGMIEFPSTNWRDDAWSDAEAAAEAPVPGEWSMLDGEVEHTFTHFHLRLSVMMLEPVSANELPEGCRLVAPDDFGREALPTVMKKVAAFATKHQSS